MYNALRAASIVSSVLALVFVIVCLATSDWIKFCVDFSSSGVSASEIFGKMAKPIDTCLHTGLFKGHTMQDDFIQTLLSFNEKIADATAAFLAISALLLLLSITCNITSAVHKASNNVKSTPWQKYSSWLAMITGILLVIASLMFTIENSRVQQQLTLPFGLQKIGFIGDSNLSLASNSTFDLNNFTLPDLNEILSNTFGSENSTFDVKGHDTFSLQNILKRNLTLKDQVQGIFDDDSQTKKDKPLSSSLDTQSTQTSVIDDLDSFKKPLAGNLGQNRILYDTDSSSTEDLSSLPTALLPTISPEVGTAIGLLSGLGNLLPEKKEDKNDIEDNLNLDDLQNVLQQLGNGFDIDSAPLNPGKVRNTRSLRYPIPERAFGYSFYLCWCATVLSILVAILDFSLLRLAKRKAQQKDNDVYMA
ncbi:uncharacterized protein LOC143456625 [Clavelina lepadiformis]|uniref:uncharacterized protein LOC143456625 n=1 Tax=Clavelina lepadiformis TaxID=159417 RepID=UPI0040439311